MDFGTTDLFANKSAEEELQVLRSIYTENELQEERTKECQRLLFKINPDFGLSDEIVSRRYCSLQLEIDIDCNYPTCSPSAKIKNPRGLTEEEVRCLETQISSYLSDNKGQLVLYDIIQLAQDFSVSEEVPTLPCSICLNKFLADDSIFVTSECHHHFHSHCLGRYVEHCVKEKRDEREILPAIEKDSVKDDISCPLCRCLITCPIVDDLLNSKPPDSEIITDSSNEWSHLANPIERKFRDLYEKQKRQGGLIDHEEERKRMLVTDDIKICMPVNVISTQDESSAPSTSKTKSEPGHAHSKQFYSKEFKNSGKNKRYYYQQNNKRFYGYHNMSTVRNDEDKQSTTRRLNEIQPSDVDKKNSEGIDRS